MPRDLFETSSNKQTPNTVPRDLLEDVPRGTPTAQARNELGRMAREGLNVPFTAVQPPPMPQPIGPQTTLRGAATEFTKGLVRPTLDMLGQFAGGALPPPSEEFPSEEDYRGGIPLAETLLPKTGTPTERGIGAVGEVAGAFLPGIGFARKAMQAKQLPTALQENLEAAKRLSIQLPASAAGSGAAKRFEVALRATPGGAQAFTNLYNKNIEQLNKHFLKQLGQTSATFDNATKAAISRRISEKYDNALQGTAIAPDKQLTRDFANLKLKEQAFVKPMQQRVIDKYIKDPVFQRPMSGDIYNAHRSRIGRDIAKAEAGGDWNKAEALEQLQDTLDDWAIRRLGPVRSRNLQEARSEYRIWKTLQSTIDPSTGNLDPAKFLRQVERKAPTDVMYGRGTFGEPARAASLLRPPPQPFASPLSAVLPSVIGAGAGGAYGGPEGAMMGALASYALPYAGAAIYLNPALRGAIGGAGRVARGTAAGFVPFGATQLFGPRD